MANGLEHGLMLCFYRDACRYVDRELLELTLAIRADTTAILAGMHDKVGGRDCILHTPIGEIHRDDA
jgi:hypothetical protein